MSLDKALEFLLAEEGGWSNHPADRGGATMYGVTQATYDQWRTAIKQPKQSVSKMPKEEAFKLYNFLYWQAAGCDKLPWPISYLVFDAAVNSGPNRAVRWMQAGLGLTQDGVIGSKTLAAAQQVLDEGNANKLIAIVDARVTFLARLCQRSPSQIVFLLGWWRRTLRVLSRALLSEIEDQ